MTAIVHGRWTNRTVLSVSITRRELSFELRRAVGFSFDFATVNRKLSIRMVAGFVEVVDRKEILVAGGCNHPNCLVLPFTLELIRPAA